MKTWICKSKKNLWKGVASPVFGIPSILVGAWTFGERSQKPKSFPYLVIAQQNIKMILKRRARVWNFVWCDRYLIRLNYNLVWVLVTSKLNLPWTFNISPANPNLYHLRYHTLIITKFTVQLSDWKIALLIKLLRPPSSYIVNNIA